MTSRPADRATNWPRNIVASGGLGVVKPEVMRIARESASVETEHGEIGGLAGFEAAGLSVQPERPGAVDGGHLEQRRTGNVRVVADAGSGPRRGCSRWAMSQAVGPEADDDPGVEHGPERVRRVAEPGVGPGAIGDRRPAGAGRRRGARRWNSGGSKMLPWATIQSARQPGRRRGSRPATGRRAASLGPGSQALDELAERPGAVGEERALRGHLAEVGCQRQPRPAAAR